MFIQIIMSYKRRLLALPGMFGWEKGFVPQPCDNGMKL